MSRPPPIAHRRWAAGVPGDKERDNQAFWTVAIGVPVLLSVLRLWIEAGGELQTTLLLVEHIDAINLVAGLIATASWLVAAVVVAVLAIGGVLNASETGQRYWIARWSARAPTWVGAGGFLMAAVTWQLLYLPLLLLAACAAYQFSPWRSGSLWRGALMTLSSLGAYFALTGPTLAAAWQLHALQPRIMAVLLLAAPPLLAVVITGPMRPWSVRPFALLSQAAAAVLFATAALPLVTTPVLPLSVTVIRGESRDEPTTYVRGHTITTDDAYTVVLREEGGVTYVPNDRIEARHLCRTEEEIPRYRLELRLPEVERVSLEHSVLRALGQANRGSAPVSPACRAPAG